MGREDKALSLAELAETSGVPPRTIRYYIARGLVDGPLQAGRDAQYGAGHLARLREILQLQKRGLRLAEIGSATPAAKSLPEPDAVWRYGVAPGVTVEVSANLSPWRVRQVKGLLAELAAQLRTPEDESQKEHE